MKSPMAKGYMIKYCGVGAKKRKNIPNGASKRNIPPVIITAFFDVFMGCFRAVKR
jgi:hypothetical protein